MPVAYVESLGLCASAMDTFTANSGAKDPKLIEELSNKRTLLSAGGFLTLGMEFYH